MVADVTMIGSGGRLYRDAREKGEARESREKTKARESREKTREKERVTNSEATVKRFQKRLEDNPETVRNESPLDDRPLPPAPPPWVVKPHHEEPKPKRDWTELQSTILEIIGVLILSGSLSVVYLPLGGIVLGICMIAMGVALGLPDGIPRRRRR